MAVSSESSVDTIEAEAGSSSSIASILEGLKAPKLSDLARKQKTGTSLPSKAIEYVVATQVLCLS